MEECEAGSSPSKPKNPFKKKVWFSASVDKNRQVSAEVKEKCRALLHQAIGKVQISYPDASVESKNLLLRTSENIMQGLDKAFQLRVLDPAKLEKNRETYETFLQQAKRKRAEMEQCNDRARAWYEELQHQHEPEIGQGSSAGSSPRIVAVRDDDLL